MTSQKTFTGTCPGCKREVHFAAFAKLEACPHLHTDGAVWIVPAFYDDTEPIAVCRICRRVV